MKINVNGSGNSIYEIDTEELTCTCPHWRYRCHNYSKMHPGRYCKHMHQLFEDRPELAPKEYRTTNPSDVAVVEDDKIRYPRILFEPYVKLINNIIKIFPNITFHEVCGSYRRQKDFISDIDILLTTSPDMSFPDEFLDFIEKLQGYDVERLWRGDKGTGKKVSYKINKLFQIDFILVPEESLPFALAHFTGSKEENIELRRIAAKRKHSLSQYGLKSDADGVTYTYGIKTERDLYDWLGVPYKEPWSR